MTNSARSPRTSGASTKLRPHPTVAAGGSRGCRLRPQCGPGSCGACSGPSSAFRARAAQNAPAAARRASTGDQAADSSAPGRAASPGGGARACADASSWAARRRRRACACRAPARPAAPACRRGRRSQPRRSRPPRARAGWRPSCRTSPRRCGRLRSSDSARGRGRPRRESRLVNSAFELSELGLDVLPHRVRCFTVPHRELKSHRHSSPRERSQSNEPPRAKDTARTRRAPARRSAEAQAFAVAPVVYTSSTVPDRATRHVVRHGEGAADVAASLGEGEATPAWNSTGSFQERDDRQVPPCAQLTSECSRRRVTALEHAVAVSRHEGECGDGRSRHHCGDEVGRHGSEVAAPVFLPRRDERTCPALVDDRSASGREREPPAGALGTAVHGPRAREPHRSQSGGDSLVSAARQTAHTPSPTTEQTAQRCGRTTERIRSIIRCHYRQRRGRKRELAAGDYG